MCRCCAWQACATAVGGRRVPLLCMAGFAAAMGGRHVPLLCMAGVCCCYAWGVVGGEGVLRVERDHT